MSKSRPQPWITARKEQPANGQSMDKSVPGPKPISGLRWASVTRWLHLYLSVVSFVLILFFAVTGLTLNHADEITAFETTRAGWRPRTLPDK